MITIWEAATAVIIISALTTTEGGTNSSSKQQRETGTTSPPFGKSNPFLRAKINFSWGLQLNFGVWQHILMLPVLEVQQDQALTWDRKQNERKGTKSYS